MTYDGNIPIPRGHIRDQGIPRHLWFANFTEILRLVASSANETTSFVSELDKKSTNRHDENLRHRDAVRLSRRTLAHSSFARNYFD